MGWLSREMGEWNKRGVESGDGDGLVDGSR